MRYADIFFSRSHHLLEFEKPSQVTINGCHPSQVTGLGVGQQPKFGLAFVDGVRELAQVLALRRQKHRQQTNSHPLRDKLGHGEDALTRKVGLTLGKCLLRQITEGCSGKASSGAIHLHSDATVASNLRRSDETTLGHC